MPDPLQGKKNEGGFSLFAPQIKRKGERGGRGGGGDPFSTGGGGGGGGGGVKVGETFARNQKSAHPPGC